MKICPSCNAENRPDAEACYACGRRLINHDPARSQPGLPSPAAGNPTADLGQTQPRRVRPAGSEAPGETLPGAYYRPPAPPPGGPTRPAWEPDSLFPPDQPGSIQPGLPVTQSWETRPGQGIPSPSARQAYAAQPGRTRPFSGAQPPGGGPPAYPPVEPLFPSQPLPVGKPARDTAPAWRVVSILLLVILGCVGIFAVWTIGASMVNGLRRTVTPAQTQSAGGIPGEQPAATAVVEALPATPTPWPTFTAQPTVALAPQETAAAQATPETGPDLTRYLTPECAAALEHLQSANKTFGENPGAVFDKAWRDDLSQAVEQMKAYCGTLESASPVPNQVEEAHRNLNLATESFDNAGRLLKEGAEQLNPGKFIEAGGQLIQAGKYLAQALSELDKIGEQE